MTQNSSTLSFIDAFYEVLQVFVTFECKHDLLKCGIRHEVKSLTHSAISMKQHLQLNELG